MHEILLEGCRRQPLADYLKALGVFRLVAEQIDPDTRAWWTDEAMCIRSPLDRVALVEFLTTSYSPSPIVAPWNGSSGFYPKDTQDGIAAIAASTSDRFRPFREAIVACRDLVRTANLLERPQGAEKQRLIERARATLSDEALRWIDAAVALENDGPAYPPLLGTGGNDGHLEFSNNQMQRLAEVLIESGGAPSLLRAALFDQVTTGLSRAAIGQFRPTATGGANASEGFKRGFLVNPWDYILALEGALVFAVAVTRRLESALPGAGTFPFTVRASGSGYGSAARVDEVDERGSPLDEIWLPIWSRPASYYETCALFGEGRATVGTRAVRTGIDFARAITSLGGDRGIEEFSRVGFLLRNGKSFFATPLGDWQVAHKGHVGLLDEIDVWLSQLDRAASGKHAPAMLRRVASRVDDAILGICRRGDPSDVGALVAALGATEAVCARSPKARDNVRPLPALSHHWLHAIDDGSIELRLAVALATNGWRRYLNSARKQGAAFVWSNDDGDVVCSDQPLVDNLIAIVRRREMIGSESSFDGPAVDAPDIAAFIAGETDDDRIDALARGLCSLHASGSSRESRERRELPAVFALCRLALTRRPTPSIELPHTAGIAARLAAGDSTRATRLAERRLRGAGLIPKCGPIAVSSSISRRCVAALVFPLNPSTIAGLRRQVIRTTSLEKL